ncbi:hypothetical protein ANAEL_00675 [Anaerolineales bacterium]|nr:hypothetical protein ANAEL_00675 [Anaerolineales bacterium]
MQKILGASFKQFIFFFIFGAGLTFALGFYIEFHAESNDFWNILYYGRHMSLAELESLYNGFFPFGYALLIGQLPFTYVRPLAYLLNALLAGLFTASASTLVVYARSTSATLVALFASVAAPFIFQNANTLSPDIGSVSFTAFAIFLLWRDRLGGGQEEMSDLRAILAGLSLGLAFLWRNHAIVSSVAILAGYLLFTRIRPLRPRIWMVGAFLFLVSMQVIVNLVSGHGAFETAQAFNVYKFFYGINDTYPPTPEVIEKFSIADAVLSNPKGIFYDYLLSFTYLTSFGWTALICLSPFPKGRLSRFSLFLLFFTVVYSIPVALGGSPRSPIMLMAMYVPSFALMVAALTDLAEKFFPSQKWTTALVGFLFIAASAQLFYSWVIYDASFIKTSRSERKVLSTIEQTLVFAGMESPTEVFADRYDFYTPNKMPYRSRQIGNWSQDWVWGYADEYPPLPNDSWGAFSAACREQRIRFLVLSPNSHYRGDIFPPIYNQEVDIESLGLEFIAQRGNIRIYRFK